MSKIDEAIEKLEAAKKAVGEIVNFISVFIDWRNDCIEVHVKSMRDLEQIQAECEYISRESDEYPYEAQKNYRGVKFFRLLTAQEAAEAMYQEAVTSAPVEDIPCIPVQS